jgi:small subunit ribosomal protein S5
MAVRNMDYVNRFEGRTIIWTGMSSKLGATRIILRPRPVGFGLYRNPNVHQVLKAAGIKDISAKVWCNRLNVIKLLFRMLTRETRRWRWVTERFPELFAHFFCGHENP